MLSSAAASHPHPTTPCVPVASPTSAPACADPHVTALRGFIERMPKMELHAHLSGSVRTATVRQLITQHYPAAEVEEQYRLCRLVAGDATERRTMSECFALFAVLHRIISTADILFQVTLDCLEDFVFGDRVMYLELRTTPRALLNPATGESSKQFYLETVFAAFKLFSDAVSHYNTVLDTDSESSRTDAVAAAVAAAAATAAAAAADASQLYPPARPASAAALAAAFRDRHGAGAASHFQAASLLISVDRSASVADAEATVALAAQLRAHGHPVAGIDLSGNPFSKTFADFAPALTTAKQQHALPVTLHFAETDSAADADGMLAFAPDRLGHAALLTPELFRRVRASAAPVEVCLTSNLLCKLHASLDTHPFLSFHSQKHVWLPCTDDMGVFGSTLNDEWTLLLAQPGFQYQAAAVCASESNKAAATAPESKTLSSEDTCAAAVSGLTAAEDAVLLLKRKKALVRVAMRGVTACFCAPPQRAKLLQALEAFYKAELLD